MDEYYVIKELEKLNSIASGFDQVAYSGAR